ncbi:endoplasmic reticulum-Golgi intermediate compartment protein 1 isoform X2 [Hemicordylus capensis]|uniref:endoplasmic reticulum-Golgi intermediate compartment protein 1 isoform X2 n=1 Tax=Hemicordylus capensis TaxID=884348 RepID=UPI002302F1A3|nr:endoplasmic reticulum-Golgi intermediate compartment protein 1 isoform X2 [Hemicordylus capensis]
MKDHTGAKSMVKGSHGSEAKSLYRAAAEGRKPGVKTRRNNRQRLWLFKGAELYSLTGRSYGEKTILQPLEEDQGHLLSQRIWATEYPWVSVCCCFFILFLFLSELTGFIATEIVNELYVDDPDKDSGGKIEVNLNISLPNLHCELIGLDIQDEMGRHEVGHIDNSMKIPLNNGDGCRFEGRFSINKVPGNFHVSTHSATAQPQNPDMTHVIHKLCFGDTLQVQSIHGAFNALEGADKLSSNPLASHDYILKIVPTVYEDMSGKQRYSYQYTVANKEYVAYSHTGRIIPAIWFRYDLSPITVKYTERRQPLYRFITTISDLCYHWRNIHCGWDS